MRTEKALLEAREGETEKKDILYSIAIVLHVTPNLLFASDKFENNGLAIDPTLNDIGRMKITNKQEDYLRFKVPTLRNIQFTFRICTTADLKH